MASGITLSAGVRQNLLSLQNTASMMASTQNRLATGKKVNSALDNPSNFFTSQTLADRAGDLNGLLDSIGQATKTLDAANNGITSLTKLVQSAKSIAQQARSATSAVETFSSVDSSANILGSSNLNGAEATASFTGANTLARTNLLEALPVNIQGATITAETAATTTSVNTGAAGNRLDAAAIAFTGATVTETTATATANAATTSANIGALNTNTGLSAGTLRISVTSRNGTAANFDISLSGEDDQAAVKATMDATTATVNGNAGTRLDSLVNVSYVANKLTITAANTGVDFEIQGSGGGSTAGTLTELGLTGAEVDTLKQSSSLFDQLKTNDASIQSKTLTIDGTDSTGVAFAQQTLTFGTGAGEVNTMADLNSRLGAAQAATGSAFTASVSSNQMSFSKASGTKSSLTIGGTAKDTTSNATLLEGSTAGTVFGTHNSTKTIADAGKTLAAGNGGPFTITSPSLKISLNGGADVTVALNATDRVDDVVNTLNANVTLAAKMTFSKTTDGTGDHITAVSKDENTDFTIKANATSAALGLTADNVTDKVKESDSLFNRLKANGAVNGDTLTIAGANADGTAFSTQTITFGNGGVKSADDLNAALTTAASASGGAFSASVSGGKLTITKPAGTKASVTVGGTVGGIGANKILLEGATAGTVFSTHNSQKTLADIGTAQSSPELANGGALNFTVNNTNYTVGLSATDRIDDVVSKLNSSAVASKLTFSKNTDNAGHDHIKIEAKDSSVDFTVNANNTSDAMGLTTDNVTATTGNSTSLLDLMDTAFGSAGLAQGKTLTVSAQGGKDQTITFGTGSSQVQTLDQLNTKLGELSGVTAQVSDTGALSIQIASGTKETDLKIGGTAAAKLGLTAGETKGTVISTSANQIRTNLQSDFNNVLDQIDALAKDSSYNGINLLNGDDLKVTFNENGSSSLTIKGVNFDSNNLGMNAVKGDTFQDNDQIDLRISSIDSALSDLRSQGSKFGSNLSTVQTRQEFTKNMINTLQTGSDSLVLADTNEEGANLLALQTRQQLSTTALSMSAQQDQAVLRLF